MERVVKCQWDSTTPPSPGTRLTSLLPAVWLPLSLPSWQNSMWVTNNHLFSLPDQAVSATTTGSPYTPQLSLIGGVRACRRSGSHCPRPGPLCPRLVNVSMTLQGQLCYLLCPVCPAQTVHLSCSWQWHFHPPSPSCQSQGSESHSKCLSLQPPHLPLKSHFLEVLQWHPSIPQAAISHRCGSSNHRSFLLASSLPFQLFPTLASARSCYTHMTLSHSPTQQPSVAPRCPLNKAQVCLSSLLFELVEGEN